MSTPIFLVSLFCICIISAIIVILSGRKARGHRKSVEYLAQLLQNVNEHKEDLELAVHPSKQEALKAEWLNNICDSQVCYRRDVSRWLDLLEECYGRMRRNGKAVREVLRAERYMLRKLHRAAIQEAQRKLADLPEIIDLLIAEGMEGQNGEYLKALINGFANFMKLVRFSGRNKESVAPMIQNLMRRSQELTRVVAAEFADNEDVKGIVNALVDTTAKLLDAFVVLNHNLEMYLKLGEVAEATTVFLHGVRRPLAFAWFWSWVPLESWRFLPVPTLSEYGESRGVNVLIAYQQMKFGVVQVANLLYPGFPSIAGRIESTM